MLVVGYDSDGKDPDDTLQKVLQINRQVNLKLNKDKCHSVAHLSNFWRGAIKALSKTSPMKAECAC